MRIISSPALLVLMLQHRGLPSPRCSCPCSFKSKLIFNTTHQIIRHYIFCSHAGGGGGLRLISIPLRLWVHKMLYAHCAKAFFRKPVTCKEALFRRCFNPRWQCPPLSVPAREVSVVATRRPDHGERGVTWRGLFVRLLLVGHSVPTFGAHTCPWD